MRKLILLFLLITKISSAQSEREIILNFNNTFNTEKIKCEEEYYHFSPSDSVLFETIRYYISSVKFYNDHHVIFAEKNSFHLIDAAENNVDKIIITAKLKSDFDSISFNLGIDSATNVAGVMGADLDPVKGMYWTWQSGYINFKLEGKSNRCNSRNHEFQFHLGGYLQPNYAMQEIGFTINNSSVVNINFPLEKLPEIIHLSELNSVMIPGDKAVELSKKIAELFFVSK